MSSQSMQQAVKNAYNKGRKDALAEVRKEIKELRNLHPDSTYCWTCKTLDYIFDKLIQMEAEIK